MGYELFVLKHLHEVLCFIKGGENGDSLFLHYSFDLGKYLDRENIKIKWSGEAETVNKGCLKNMGTAHGHLRVKDKTLSAMPFYCICGFMGAYFTLNIPLLTRSAN